MHPILSHRGRLGPYLAAWLPIAGLLAALLKISSGIHWHEAAVLALPLTLIYAFLCLATWYLCRTFPLHDTRLARLLGVNLVAAFLTSSVWMLIGQGWVAVLARVPQLSDLESDYAAAIPILFGAGLLLFFLAAAAHYLIIAFESSREAERQALELEVLAREAELKLLKAQIDPHFLFNSLNSISALIGADPPGARRMCLLLADFLRKSLALAARTRIPFEEELSLAAGFLAIEQVRFGSRLRVQQEVAESSLGCLVPPLLLQPLVENAVKHGIAHLLAGGEIHLRARASPGRLWLSVENPCDPESTGNPGRGLGLQNVRNRLITLYGSEARLETRKEPDRFTVELSLPAAAKAGLLKGEEAGKGPFSRSAANDR